MGLGGSQQKQHRDPATRAHYGIIFTQYTALATDS